MNLPKNNPTKIDEYFINQILIKQKQHEIVNIIEENKMYKQTIEKNNFKIQEMERYIDELEQTNQSLLK
uniref:Uncharacterized protein n=1 Tax=Acrobeloides nanus TaxID=290746 RepID=A0A914ENI8_9BILA